MEANSTNLSNASNVIDTNLLNDIITYVEVPPGGSVIRYTVTGSVSVTTSATQRIGQKINRKTVSKKEHEQLTDTGTRVGSITLFGDQQNISEVDGYRQGKNVITVNHYAKGILPFISINTGRLSHNSGIVTHGMQRVNYGQSSLFKIFDDRKRKIIPFEDFPGRLDPKTFIEAGNYVMQYMIINDLTRNIDQYIDPDTMDGVIEVFEIRKRNANTNSADIQINGIRCDLSTGDWNFDQKGSSIVDTKYEKNQSEYDYFEDAQDQLFLEVTFSKREKTPSGSDGRIFTLDGYISDGVYKISPFIESKDTETYRIMHSVRNFISSSKGSTSSTFDHERNTSEIGTRYNASNSGFIFDKNNVNSNVSGIHSFGGMESIAFGGLKK